MDRRRAPQLLNGISLARVVLAVPVAAPEALARLASAADEIVCLEAPEWFHAVGQFYRDFAQLSDAEVIALLARAREAASGSAGGAAESG